ncbi:hypothetical protein Ndes2526A_g08721 [Nannochloris sp. 'desiccata']
MATSQVKISSFYGESIARPYMVLNKNGQAVQDRVEKPSANAGLLAWAAKAPYEAGGALQKPAAYSKAPPKARHEFVIFCETERAEILASNPSLLSDFEEKAFKVAASLYWKEKLSDDQRAKYKDMAYLEQRTVKRATEQLAQEDPEFAQHLEKEAAYKRAKSALVTAQKMSAGPLWRAEREMNKAHNKTKENAKENTDPVEKKQQQQQKKKFGGRKAKVPEALKMKYVERPTKRYEVRSKQKAAKIAAEKKKTATAATTASPTRKGEYSGEFALPDAPEQEKRVTRSNPTPVVAKKTKVKAAPPPPPPVSFRRRNNKRK